MVLDTNVIKKINDFVYAKPRTIQEVAHLIDKNWRTVDRYVEKMAEETGSVSVRTFREGTRGALKIVFWNNIENIHSTEFQERLFKQIYYSRWKEDFSPFDIFQYVEKKKRKAVYELEGKKNICKDRGRVKDYLSAQHQILCFSGNMSWINFVEEKKKIVDVLENIAPNISIKILSRIDFGGHNNILDGLAINNRLGKEAIEIRHSFQPLRGYIIDSRKCVLVEIKETKMYRKGELKKNMIVFYEFYDEEWIEWLQKVFWNLFRTAVPAKKRIEDINDIKKII